MVKVAIQGEAGSYHEVVAKQFFGDELESIYCSDFETVFENTYQKESDYGVIAIENSIVGSLLDNYDLLLRYDLRIRGERYLRISHSLLVPQGVKARDVQEVLSHPIALRQCKSFLKRFGRKWRILETEDTAGSCKIIQEEGRPFSAAIASAHAAEPYGMEILFEGIETNKRNYTRFFIISPKVKFEENVNKTSIVFTAADKPGSLGRVFQLFAEEKINVSKIESRPILGAEWQYYFYLDYEEGLEHPASKRVLEKIHEFVDFVRVLGSYRKGVLTDTSGNFL